MLVNVLNIKEDVDMEEDAGMCIGVVGGLASLGC